MEISLHWWYLVPVIVTACALFCVSVYRKKVLYKEYYDFMDMVENMVWGWGYEEHEVTTASWAKDREEVKRWCDG